ncbi:hypothetical protein [Burkholderia dolosa]|uniref:hypothetical protein n=1 Tax=Burkholderia dolosa TaxID=152500 RepID=UPI001B9FF339|nr:hypothetical protein [Burkholderia dolosa]MBR8060224.1 hypothetical protein [Burkholderia dolosa]
MSNVCERDRGAILAKAADGTLVDALFGEYGRVWLHEDSPTIDLLTEMHNNGEIDLLAIVTPEAIERHRGRNFFNGQHLYEQLIPRISGSVREMLRVVELLRVGGGNDMAAGLHIDKFAVWCGAEPTRPMDLLALIDEGVPNADTYLVIAIKTGVHVDRELFTMRAYEFLESGTERQRLSALCALGQIEMLDAAEWDRLLGALTAAQDANDDDAFRGQLLSAVANRVKGAPPERVAELNRMAAMAVANGGSQTLYVAARILAFEAESLAEDLRERLLHALRGVGGESHSTIELLDIALSKLVSAGQVDAVRRFAEDLLTRPDDTIKLQRLDSMVRALVDDPGNALADWTVAWLRNGNYRLCSAMDRAMFGAGRDDRALSVDFTRYGLSDEEYPYLARKAVATFFLKPLLTVSLLTSLLRTAPTNAAAKVEDVLIGPVLHNYAGVARDHLVSVADDPEDPAASAARRALDAQDAYLDGLNSPGRVLELHPSEHERQLEWERHADSMSDAIRKARKDSIISKIVTESVMLYGNSAVSWIDLPGGKPRRIETKLGSVGTSFEMPRVDIVDPIGLQLMLLTFRSEESPR